MYSRFTMTISQNGWSHVNYMYPLSLLSGQKWIRYIVVVCVYKYVQTCCFTCKPSFSAWHSDRCLFLPA